MMPVLVVAVMVALVTMIERNEGVEDGPAPASLFFRAGMPWSSTINWLRLHEANEGLPFGCSFCIMMNTN